MTIQQLDQIRNLAVGDCAQFEFGSIDAAEQALARLRGWYTNGRNRVGSLAIVHDGRMVRVRRL